MTLPPTASLFFSGWLLGTEGHLCGFITSPLPFPTTEISSPIHHLGFPKWYRRAIATFHAQRFPEFLGIVSWDVNNLSNYHPLSIAPMPFLLITFTTAISRKPPRLWRTDTRGFFEKVWFIQQQEPPYIICSSIISVSASSKSLHVDFQTKGVSHLKPSLNSKLRVILPHWICFITNCYSIQAL